MRFKSAETEVTFSSVWANVETTSLETTEDKVSRRGVKFCKNTAEIIK